MVYNRVSMFLLELHIFILGLGWFVLGLGWLYELVCIRLGLDWFIPGLYCAWFILDLQMFILALH